MSGITVGSKYQIGRASCRERVKITEKESSVDVIRVGHVTGVQTCALPISVENIDSARVDSLKQLVGFSPGQNQPTASMNPLWRYLYFLLGDVLHTQNPNN